jgi:hypothetical protein
LPGGFLRNSPTRYAERGNDSSCESLTVWLQTRSRIRCTIRGVGRTDRLALTRSKAKGTSS